MVWLAGVTAIETRVAAVTVSEVDPTTEPDVADIEGDPLDTACARPVLLIVAAAVDEAHVTWFVKFCVLPSLYVPVAVYCKFDPAAMLWFAGVTAIDARVGGGPCGPKTWSSASPALLPTAWVTLNCTQVTFLVGKKMGKPVPLLDKVPTLTLLPSLNCNVPARMLSSTFGRS